MNIDMPPIRSQWTPVATTVDLSSAAPGPSWADRLAAARAALAAAHIDLTNTRDDDDAVAQKRADLIADHRRQFGI